MATPKKKMTAFVQTAKYECPQVNLHVGRKYAYWYIQDCDDSPFKLLKGEVPEPLQAHLQDDSVKKLQEFSR